MKIIVIGCTHAGTAAIVNTLNTNPNAEITVYERNDNISFLSCGIALYVGGVVKDVNGLFYNSPENLAKSGVVTKMKHDVQNVDFDNKRVTVQDMESGNVFEDSYDKLIITSGSWPIIPPIEGIDSENIVLSKNFNHSNQIIEKAKDAKKIVVVGAGYIGVELVEAFEMQGKAVTLIDAQDRIMSKYLDKEFTNIAENEFMRHGVKIALGEMVQKFDNENGKVTAVVTDKGRYEADLVILCIGFRPNTDLFKGKIDMLPNGAIVIDEYMRTSQKDVFAAGDSCTVIYNPTKTKKYIPLATNAVRMGTVIGMNINEPKIKYIGTQSTSGIKIYDLNIAATGMTEEVAIQEGFEVKTVLVEDNYRPEFMPTYEKAMLKLVVDKKTEKVLGGQILSKVDLTQMMNTLSVAIQNEMTVQELAMVDFFFQPHFNKPWSLLNIAALKLV